MLKEATFVPTPEENILAALEPPPPPRRRRTWGQKFKVAFRGVKLGVRGHSSFCVHIFFTALVLLTALALDCERLEWCLLIGCIGLVLTAELFNSTIETLFRGLPNDLKKHTWPSLDIAAGGVLLASLTASVIGLLVFVPKFLPRLRQLAEWLGIS
jgi:diacylglycerol kinase